MAHWLRSRQWRWGRHLLLALVALLLAVQAGMATASVTLAEPTLVQGTAPITLEQQARALYDSGQFLAAAQRFQRAAEAYQTQGDRLAAVTLLSNAALAAQKGGDWPLAATTSEQALALVESVAAADRTPADWLALGSALDVRSRLWFTQGQGEQAAVGWADAARAYQQAGAVEKAHTSRLSQGQALQAAGFYRRSLEVLSRLQDELASQPDSLTAVITQRTLGEALRVTGDLTQAGQQLQASLAMAQRLQLPDQVSLAQRGLGDIAKLRDGQRRPEAALAAYEQAVAAAQSPLPQLQARLKQLDLLIASGQWLEAYGLGSQLWDLVEALPPGRASLYARIDFGRHLVALRRATTQALTQQQTPAPFWYVLNKKLPPTTEVATLLLTTRQQAQVLGDAQAEAYALGELAALYEQTQQWDIAADLAQAALVIAQSNNAAAVAYGLQAQLGRIQLAQGDRQAAIKAYSASVNTLQAVRQDVVAVSSEAQYSFQQSIEPIYRELVTLLLDSEEPSAADLKQAREVIESLQLAELDNFFREACLSTETVEIDQLDSRAAVFYPIILPQRLDVVISLPNRQFTHFSVPIDPQTFGETLAQLQQAVSNPLSDVESTRSVEVRPDPGAVPRLLPPAQQLYDWLIRPAEEALAAANTETLVFVLDGRLRNVPMAVLHDGEQYLLEHYAIALTPGLQLLDPRPLPRSELSVIAAGLSQVSDAAVREGWGDLPFVEQEVDTIQQHLPSTVLLNQAFSVNNFETRVGTLPAPIVHLATHGQFSSNLQDTFVLTWDDKLTADEFSNVLLTSELSRQRPVELLVLSACETAAGDDRAVLGLAGIAIRSGARSTLATLWQVSDPATAQLMGQFYQTLGQSQTTKAEAIRAAQLNLLRSDDYSHPYYWAAFVLVGNWL